MVKKDIYVSKGWNGEGRYTVVSKGWNDEGRNSE